MYSKRILLIIIAVYSLNLYAFCQTPTNDFSNLINKDFIFRIISQKEGNLDYINHKEWNNLDKNILGCKIDKDYRTCEINLYFPEKIYKYSINKSFNIEPDTYSDDGDLIKSINTQGKSIESSESIEVTFIKYSNQDYYYLIIHFKSRNYVCYYALEYGI